MKARMDSFKTEHRANAEPEGSEPIEMGRPSQRSTTQTQERPVPERAAQDRQSQERQQETQKTAKVAAAPAAQPASASGKKRPPRRARLRLTRIDPWSVMKTAFLLAIAFGIVTVVAILMVWTVLNAAGVWDSVNATVQNAIGGEDTRDFDIEDYVGLSRVLGFTMLVAAIDVVLLTALATLAAFLYNMAAALLGGVELTLAEDEH